MDFGTRLPLHADSGYAGDPTMVGGPPVRAHLVTPQPPASVVRETLEGQVRILTSRVEHLEARVAYLEVPWPVRLWQDSLARLRVCWVRVQSWWKE